MARFENTTNGVVISVDDSKASRYPVSRGWKRLKDAPAPAPAPEGYDGLTVADLREEIAKRNSDRDADAQLPAEGKKADLIAVLEADDQA